MRANKSPVISYDSVSAEGWKHSHNLIGKRELEEINLTLNELWMTPEIRAMYTSSEASVKTKQFL